MSTRMFALLTVSGTAMAETGICFDCLDFVPNSGADALVAIARTCAEWDGHEWFEDVTGNPEITCHSSTHAALANQASQKPT